MRRFWQMAGSHVVAGYLLCLAAHPVEAADFPCVETPEVLARRPPQLLAETSLLLQASRLTAESTTQTGTLAFAVPISVGVTSRVQEIPRSAVEMTITGEDVRARVTVPATIASGTAGAKLRDDLATPISCTATTVVDANAANTAALGLAGGRSGALRRLIQEYKSDQQLFASAYGSSAAQTISRYLETAKLLLQRCYRPAEQSTFVKTNHLQTRIGGMLQGDTAFCTALLLGNGDYVLTARHCFTYGADNTSLPHEQLADMWFRPMSSMDRYQICAIAEASAFDATKFREATDDQVVVRIAPRLQPVDKLALVFRDTLESLEEMGTLPDAPTALQSISIFPHASLVDPTYPSGLVEPLEKGCFVVKKQKGCFLHFCGVVSGGSGSALFVRDAKNLTLAGTHIGFNLQSQSDCPGAAGSQSNVATYPNPTLFSAVQQ